MNDEVRSEAARRLKHTYQALQACMARTLLDNDTASVESTRGRHRPGLAAIRHRLRVLLYAELRSKVASSHNQQSALFLLDQTGYHDVRTVLHVLLRNLAPARMMRFQRWYITQLNNKEGCSVSQQCGFWRNFPQLSTAKSAERCCQEIQPLIAADDPIRE